MLADPNDIAFIFKNTPDIKSGKSRGYTIGYRSGRKEIVADDVGDKIALVMEQKAKKEYGGHLVTPKGDPLRTVMETGIRIDQKSLDENVVKKPRGNQ